MHKFHFILLRFKRLCNSYTMGCSPVRGDNPRSLASVLSYVQVDKLGITIYTTYISVELAHHELFHAKVGKGGIKQEDNEKHKYFRKFRHISLCCPCILKMHMVLSYKRKAVHIY